LENPTPTITKRTARSKESDASVLLIWFGEPLDDETQSGGHGQSGANTYPRKTEFNNVLTNKWRREEAYLQMREEERTLFCHEESRPRERKRQ
jgi:hypothetical protein